MANLTKEHALRIAKKLGATITGGAGKAHDLALIYHEGRLIAHFGIRRGSRKDLGHDHIPAQLYIRAGQARLLAQCPLSRKDWLTILEGKGLL
jgi:hypothetical protein